MPANKTNVEEIKQSNTSELSCSYIVDPPQHTTITSKAESGASNNYWQTEDMSVLTDVKMTRDGPTFQLPNNETMSAKITRKMPLARSLIPYAKKRTYLMA